jgi:ribosomal protein S18 acetylase RimI-like enzyme
MLNLRSARWPEDLSLLARLDTSFAMDLIYRLRREDFGFSLVEETVGPPLHKDYGSVPTINDRIQEMDCSVVAEMDGKLVGFAAAEYEGWNRCLNVRDLYVSADQRQRGVGRALIGHLEAFARRAGARCLWLETQNVNYPAIRFYRRMGFRLCGLDEARYDPAGAAGKEVALFFVREVA